MNNPATFYPALSLRCGRNQVVLLELITVEMYSGHTFGRPVRLIRNGRTFALIDQHARMSRDEEQPGAVILDITGAAFVYPSPDPALLARLLFPIWERPTFSLRRRPLSPKLSLIC